MNASTMSTSAAVWIGIDWADREHAVHILPDGEQPGMSETLRQEPEAIAAWVERLQARFPQRRLLVTLEQSRGALMAGLAGHECLELYPLNPKQLASYRDAVYPSGSKDDPEDAELLALFLRDHQPRLRRWRPDAVETRRLGELSELRRQLVEERKRVVLRLAGSLKLYFPLALQFAGHSLSGPLLLDLLRRWPTLQELKRVHPKTLRKFLAEHGVKNADRQTNFIQSVRGAAVLTTDQALIAPRAKYVQALVQQVRDLQRAIAEFDEELRAATAVHPDQPLFGSLPGAGEALTPRLIAAMGSDRQRYQSALQVQCYSGIAPITRRSGQSRHVVKRQACPKFLRQTFHEFADHARKWSRWSGAFYRMKRAAGMKHQAAIRALAFKWIRIIFRMWQTRIPYSESHYLAQLQRTNSPVLKFLDTCSNPT